MPCCTLHSHDLFYNWNFPPLMPFTHFGDPYAIFSTTLYREYCYLHFMDQATELCQATLVVQSQWCLTLCHPCTAAHQASLSFTISQSLLKLRSIELVIPSGHLIFYRPLLFPSLQSFPASGSSLMSRLFASGGRSIGASASVLPVNIQDFL